MVVNKLINYLSNSKIKAERQFLNNMMEGEWLFCQELGQLWQTGNFKNSQMNGSFIRFDRNDRIENKEQFENGKTIKKKKYGKYYEFEFVLC